MQACKNMYIHKQVTIKQKIHGKFYKGKFTNKKILSKTGNSGRYYHTFTVHVLTYFNHIFL